jgi:hypothetical protein
MATVCGVILRTFRLAFGIGIVNILHASTDEGLLRPACTPTERRGRDHCVRQDGRPVRRSTSVGSRPCVSGRASCWLPTPTPTSLTIVGGGGGGVGGGGGGGGDGPLWEVSLAAL